MIKSFRQRLKQEFIFLWVLSLYRKLYIINDSISHIILIHYISPPHPWCPHYFKTAKRLNQLSELTWPSSTEEMGEVRVHFPLQQAWQYPWSQHLCSKRSSGNRRPIPIHRDPGPEMRLILKPNTLRPFNSVWQPQIANMIVPVRDSTVHA